MDPFLFFLILGVVLITIELLVLGLSAFWFLFIGFGALIAALFAYVFPESSWLINSAIFVFSSAVISLGLYKPLKQWQSTNNQLPGNDAIGQTVEVVSWDEEKQTGKVIWSGTDWEADAINAEDQLKEGDTLQIAALAGIRLKLRKAD